MIKVSIRAENWAVSATVHDEKVYNPFAGLNSDAVVAQAIEVALEHAVYSLCDPLYVLARVVVNIDERENGSLRAAALKFWEAAEEYILAAEQKRLTNHPNLKETEHG